MSQIFSGFEPLASAGMTVPPAFFNTIIASESKAVIRLISYMLTRAIEGQSAVEFSHQEAADLLGVGRSTAAEAIHHSLEAGYIECVQLGENGVVRSRYRLCWAATTPPAKANPPEGNHTRQNENHASANQPLENYAASCHDSTDSNNTILIEGTIESNSAPAQKTAYQPAKAAPKTALNQPSLSPYLQNITRDFSHALGDITHYRSNLTQTANLFADSGMTEAEFATLLYEARSRTLRYAILRQGEPEPQSGMPRNRMAYFFTVLRSLITSQSNITTYPTNYISPYARADSPLPITPKQFPPPPAKKSPQPTPPARTIPASWLRYASPAPSTFNSDTAY